MVPPFTRPIIGCTTYRKTVAQHPPIEVMGLMPSYLDAIIAAGGLPLLIPINLPEDDLPAVFAHMDGLLLPGGGDIDPHQYQGQPHPTIRDICPERDKTELRLAQLAAAQQKPILAICRGHQVFNVALGGTLWTDLPSQMPAAIAHDYYDGYPRSHLAHTVTIQPHSLLARCLNTTQIEVNSLHHQGIHTLAPDLQATAVAPDGLIEAIEIPTHPFALGVQWHPENLIHDDSNMLQLFKGLVDAAQNGR